MKTAAFFLAWVLLASVAQAQTPFAQTRPAGGALSAQTQEGKSVNEQVPEANPIKVVPRTGRKPKPERVDNSSTEPFRSGRPERSARPERSGRYAHDGDRRAGRPPGGESRGHISPRQ